jgi:hypothetical protein
MNSNLRFQCLLFLCLGFLSNLHATPGLKDWFPFGQSKTTQVRNNSHLNNENQWLLSHNAKKYDSFNEPEASTSCSEGNEQSKIKKYNSNPLPLLSLQARPDINHLMRNAYAGDWVYFRDLFKAEESLIETLKILFIDLSAVDNNKQSVVHWAIKGPNRPEKALTVFWLTVYLKHQLGSNQFKKLMLHKDYTDQSIADILMSQYIKNPFDPEDPSTHILPHLYFGLYLNNVDEPRVFYDVLAWSIARARQDEIKKLVKWRTAHHGFPHDQEQTLTGHTLAHYATKNQEMKDLLSDLFKELSIELDTRPTEKPLSLIE